MTKDPSLAPNTRAQKAPPDHFALLTITSLVIAHKFPLDLTLIYLPAILRKNDIALTDLWVLSIPLAPFWFRWAWAPLIDNIGSSRIGHRKSWILPCTLMATLVYASVSFVAPVPGNLTPLIALLTLSGLIMATQEIASDAYTVENIKANDRGVGSAYIELGRSAAAVGIAVGLMALYDHKGWSPTMLTAAGLFLFFTLPVLLRREPNKPSELVNRINAAGHLDLHDIIRSPKIFARSFFHPFANFLRRPEAFLLLGMIVFMAVNLKLVQTMMAVFFVDHGMSLTEIGALIGICAAGGSIAGALIASAMLRRFNTKRFSKICMGLMLIAYIPMIIMATFGPVNIPFAILSLASLGMLATPAQVLIMAARFGWASKAQAGTDFTLQSSSEYVGYTIGTALAGPLVAMLGWSAFYIIALIMSLTGLAIFLASHDFVQRSIDMREATERQADQESIP